MANFNLISSDVFCQSPQTLFSLSTILNPKLSLYNLQTLAAMTQSLATNVENIDEDEVDEFPLSEVSYISQHQATVISTQSVEYY